MMPPKQAEKAMRGYPCRAIVRSEKVSAKKRKEKRTIYCLLETGTDPGSLDTAHFLQTITKSIQRKSVVPSPYWDREFMGCLYCCPHNTYPLCYSPKPAASVQGQCCSDGRSHPTSSRCSPLLWQQH